MAKQKDPLDVPTAEELAAQQPPAQSPAVDYQAGRPQGITPRLSGAPHPLFGRALGIKMIDPESLKVPKQLADGSIVMDDPYLALAAPDGSPPHISQVRADHAAQLLTCDPRSGGAPTARLATDDEVKAHLAIHGRGGHGNVVPK